MRLIDIEPYERNNDCELHYNYCNADGAEQVQAINSKDIQTIDAVPEEYYNKRINEMQAIINKLKEMNSIQANSLKKFYGHEIGDEPSGKP